MSTPRKGRDRPKPADPSVLGAEKKPEDEKKDERTGLEFVFKIAPADPKNSFDFEDVADK